MENNLSIKLIKMIGEEWFKLMESYLLSDSFLLIMNKVNEYYAKYEVLPPINSDLLFKAFRVTPYNKTKVVIIGQDIYHGKNQYDGLAFSNSLLKKPQPSLYNIIKEIKNDIGETIINNYSLYEWAKQGILLINTAHTVIEGRPSSMINIWKPFTIEIVKMLNKKDNIGFILWGNHAKSYKKYITNPNIFIIEGYHPSPLTGDKFFNGKYFSRCNNELIARNIEPIIW